jgi:hypothetical protein
VIEHRRLRQFGDMMRRSVAASNEFRGGSGLADLAHRPQGLHKPGLDGEVAPLSESRFGRHMP